MITLYSITIHPCRRYCHTIFYLSGSKSPQSVLAACDAFHAGFGAAVGCMTPLPHPGGAAGAAACMGCIDCIGCCSFGDMPRVGCSGEPNPGGLFGFIGASEML